MKTRFDILVSVTTFNTKLSLVNLTDNANHIHVITISWPDTWWNSYNEGDVSIWKDFEQGMQSFLVM